MCIGGRFLVLSGDLEPGRDHTSSYGWVPSEAISNWSVFTDAGRLGLDSEEDHYTPQKVELLRLLLPKICMGITPN